MELRQLEYFQTASRLSSITKAAELLHVAQPSVSVAIQKLEKELGVTLFDRSQKNLTLTAEGQVFLARVDDTLGRLADAVLEMNDYRLLQRGSLRVGVPPMSGSFLFPYIFARFQKSYPNIELTVAEEGTMAIRSMLERGELDVGVMITSNIAAPIAVTPITTTSFFACLPPHHPLGLHSVISFSELKDEPFILFKADTYTRPLILEECAKHGFTPRIVFSSGQIETIFGLIEQGVGVSFLLEPVARKHTAIISRPLAEPLEIEIGLGWNGDRYLSNAARAFIAFIKESPNTLTPGW